MEALISVKKSHLKCSFFVAQYEYLDLMHDDGMTVFSYMF